MKIYIDFDDVICETARHFVKLAKDLFGIDLPYNEVQFFNLQKAFNLNDSQYEQLMKAGHVPETLLAYEETPLASQIINKWIDDGHEIFVITGRPFDSYEPSRKWLDNHNLTRAPLFCVDKYGRENYVQQWTYSMTLQDFYKMDFDFAVEDSPSAFEHLLHFPKCQTAVFNRPWNIKAELPAVTFTRCEGWKQIDEFLKTLQSK